MEENQIGTFIRNRRLELGMTQQQLADRLGITDKAVSKWERCVSYPDITLLRELAEALDVSVTELLAGERDSAAPQVPPEVEVTVVDTVAYAETARRKNKGWRSWLFIALTANCLIAALVLFILYWVAGSHGKQSVLLAMKCVAFGWAICCPLLRWERYPVAGALGVVTVGIIPFLYQIVQARRKWVYLAALLSAAFLWGVYFICRKLLKRRKWRAAGWSLLLGIPLTVGIYIILRIADISMNAPYSIILLALAAGVCFLMDFVLWKKG